MQFANKMFFNFNFDFDENGFLKYIKQDALDGLELNAITSESILLLLEKFQR